ncbi:MAG: RDD family protein [Nitrospirae bacterium]|nr:RDD family protein [Nitrospirota bacterium]
MLCPKCNFTTFDYADTCKKCGYDLKAYKESKGISASKPVSKPAPKPERKIEPAPIDSGLSELSEIAFTTPAIEEPSIQAAEASFDEGFAAPPPPPPPISEESISEPAYESLPPYPDAKSLPKGGFWIRYVAAFVDGIILLILQSIFGFFIGMGVGMGSVMRGGIPEEGQMLSVIIAFFVTIFIGMAYSVFFVGWRGQTLGKMALKLKIIQTNGEEMTYGKAFLRWIGYSISGLTLGIGYLMVAFSKQKQGLHDKIAGTYVIRL